LSVATMLPTDVMASDTATIAPTIVPMIRRMSPLCAPGLWQATVVPARPGSGGGLHSVRLSSQDPPRVGLPPCSPPVIALAPEQEICAYG
jgi:hypothetical protein